MKLRMIHRVLALAAVPALVGGLAACSESHSASESAGASSPRSASAEEWAAAQTKCMRAAGHDVEDPSGDGSSQGLSIGENDSIEKFTADSTRCDKEVTAKLGERPVSDQQKNNADENAKTDDCLRKNGVEVAEGKALSLDDISADVQKTCGIGTPTAGS